MNPVVLALAALLAQTEPAPASAPAPAAAPAAADPSERAAQAAEKAAVASEKAAAAAERLAAATERLADGMGAPKAVGPTVEGAPAPIDQWSGLIGLGIIWMTGNAESLTGTVNAQADKKFGGGKWMFGVRSNGAYGQARPIDDTKPSETVALRGALSLRLDRNLVDFATLYALAGLETDHIKSVEVRGFGELGSGLRLYEAKSKDGVGEFERAFVRIDLAFRYAQETRYQYYATAMTPANTALPGVTMVAPRLGVVARYALNSHVRVSEEAEFLPNIAGAPRFIVNSTTKLTAKLTSMLALNASLLVNFDSAPALGRKTTDTALTAGFEAAF